MKKYLLALVLAFAIISINSNKTIAQDNTTPNDTTIVFKVKGITCSHDCIDIAENVKTEKGIKDCIKLGEPSATTSFEVIFDPKIIKYDAIVKAIENTPGCQDPKERPYKVKKKK